MRMSHPTPTPDPLPFDHLYSGMDARHGATAIPLSDAAVVHFDQLLHEIHADAPRVDNDRLQQLAMWLLRLPSGEAQRVIDTRLQSLQSLRAMLDDPDWDCDDAIRARAAKLLAYIDREDDLIADRVPLLGQLDDVLLIELAWPEFADEVDDHRDFSAYRSAEHLHGDAGELRRQWVRDRLDEMALWQHALWVREQHYAPWRLPMELFRVS